MTLRGNITAAVILETFIISELLAVLSCGISYSIEGGLEEKVRN